MLLNRLRKNQRHLGKWARQNNIECYRLYDADIPEFAFAIDCYGDQVHMQEYKAPDTIAQDKVVLRRAQAIAAVEECLQIPAQQIVLKTRQRQRGKNQYQGQQQAGKEFVVSEGKAKFWVNLHDYLDTGLFLDHRPARSTIIANAKGKRFLNLFCYTATASVQAILAGAASSVSIDLSNTYLDWARKNYQLNGIGGSKHRLKRRDCIDYLKNTAAKESTSKQDQFDLIFLDPPTFSNSKSSNHVLDIQRDHAELIKGAMALLHPKGLLLFSTNRRRFSLDQNLGNQYQIKDHSKASIDKDFVRNQQIHQLWLIQHQSLSN